MVSSNDVFGNLTGGTTLGFTSGGGQTLGQRTTAASFEHGECVEDFLGPDRPRRPSRIYPSNGGEIVRGPVHI